MKKCEKFLVVSSKISQPEGVISKLVNIPIVMRF